MTKTGIERIEGGVEVPPGLLVPRIENDLTRRNFLIGAGIIVLAPSCGGGESGEETSANTRTIEHAMGTTEVPGRPERVVVLDTGELDGVISLGLTPVGAVTTDVNDEFLGYLREEAEEAEIVGSIEMPNLESISALEPDLILSNMTRHEAIYDQLSEIAPTVFAEEVGVVWKENFLLYARALGMEDEAESQLAEYERRAREFGESLGEADSTEVSVLRFTEGVIRAYTEDSFIGSILEDIGLSRPTVQRTREEAFVELGLETVPRADGDIILYASYGSPEESGEAEVTAGPLWQRLQAVESGEAYAVDGEIFFSGIGLTAANEVLDDLEEFLA